MSGFFVSCRPTHRMGLLLASSRATLTVTVTELSVSPLGVVVSYDLAGTPDASQEFPQLNLPVFVNFADGTSFDATWVGGFGDDTHITKGASFDRIVDADDIVSVTVGDVTIEVPHA